MWLIWMLIGAFALVVGVIVWGSLKAARFAARMGLTPMQVRAANALMGTLNRNGVRTTGPMRESLLLWTLGLDDDVAHAVAKGQNHEAALREWMQQMKEAAAGEGVVDELEAWRSQASGRAGANLTASTGAPDPRPVTSNTPPVGVPRSSAGPQPGEGSIEQHFVDLAAADASKPQIKRASRFLGWEPDTTGKGWALGVTAGLATRIRDRILAPVGVTGDSVKGVELIAADLCLVCLCDAISQRTGAMFEFTTMVAFGASGKLEGASESEIETTVAKNMKRHNLAISLFNGLATNNPTGQACFRSLGTAAIRFVTTPDEEQLGAMRMEYHRLRDCLTQKSPTR